MIPRMLFERWRPLIVRSFILAGSVRPKGIEPLSKKRLRQTLFAKLREVQTDFQKLMPKFEAIAARRLRGRCDRVIFFWPL